MNINSSYSGYSRIAGQQFGTVSCRATEARQPESSVAGDSFNISDGRCSGESDYILSDIKDFSAAFRAAESAGGTVKSSLPIVGGMTVSLPSGNFKIFENAIKGSAFIKADSDVSPCLYSSFPSEHYDISCASTAEQHDVHEEYIYSDLITRQKKTETKDQKILEHAPVVMHNAFLDSMGIDKIHESGITGKGVGVCVIDSGIAPHDDIGNIAVWKDFTAEASPVPSDRVGHGTMVAGLIAGNGNDSHGDIKGIAPDVDLIGARIGKVSEGISAIQWAIENKDRYNIKVINISMGDKASKYAGNDPWEMAVDKAVQSGIAVVVAAGNEGPEMSTITTPGTSQQAITVGALDDRQTVSTHDDDIAEKSSRGPSINGDMKPDVVAPGVNIISTQASGSFLDARNEHNQYIAQSGSSLAAPLVSGLCALMLQANPDLTVSDIKDIIMETSSKVNGKSDFEQGKGVISPEKAIEKAISMRK